MSRKVYKSDLTDKEWQIIKPLIPPPKPGGHPLGRYEGGSQCHFLSTKNWLLMGDAHLLTSHPTPLFIITFDAGKNEDFGNNVGQVLREQVRMKLWHFSWGYCCNCG